MSPYRVDISRVRLLTRHSQRANTLLEQRLLAMEQKLLSLEQGTRFDGQSPRSGRSIDAQASASPPAHRDRRAPAAGELTGPSAQDDAVDGMGAVALKDGADEDEYFGKAFRDPSLRTKLSHSP